MKILYLMYRDILYSMLSTGRKSSLKFFSEETFCTRKNCTCQFYRPRFALDEQSACHREDKELLLSQKPQTLIMGTLNSTALLTSCKPSDAQRKVMGAISIKKLSKGWKIFSDTLLFLNTKLQFVLNWIYLFFCNLLILIYFSWISPIWKNMQPKAERWRNKDGIDDS